MKIKKLFKKTISRISTIGLTSRETKSIHHADKISFIIVGEDQSLIDTTINSIRRSEISGHFSEHIIATADQATHLETPYLKVISAGDIVGEPFLTEFYQNVNFSTADDIIIHAYSPESTVFRLDPVLANIKSINKNQHLEIKEYALPCLDNCIIKSVLIPRNLANPETKGWTNSIVFALEALTRSTSQQGYQFLSNAYVGSISGERFETHIQQLVKSGSTFLNLLDCININIKHMQKDAYKLKSVLFLIHQIVTVLLKNKKSDEILTAEEKDIAQKLLINISKNIGHDIIKSFSSPNYNHIHKIGYSKIMGSHVERDICYLEGRQ